VTAISIGIPRGLFYYYHYPIWKTFFQELGLQVAVSSRTSRITVDRGTEKAVDEACFPIKVYFGHVYDLCLKKPDYIFLPRVVSIEPRSYLCPKFMGIPDMIKAVMNELPEVVEVTVDVSKNEKNLKKEIIRVGKLFGRNVKEINRAYIKALEEYYACKSLAKQGLTMDEAIRKWEGEDLNVSSRGELNIGVLGHGYSIYDERISMNIINRLRDLGCRVHLLESLVTETIEKEAATLPKRVFWTLGRKIVGAALYMDKREDIDGLIYIACFGCGPDSLIGEIIERKVKRKPYMLLTVDEHTGEAGLYTRLEAYCDMLRRRRIIDESNLSSYGQCSYSD
jgi:predicted nucleotide-binding protein (sugar kinase/HSP70/actin superfamily)